MRICVLVIAFLLHSSSAKAVELRIPWKGDYAHNSNHHWSATDKLYADSGYSRYFKNGTPEEFGVVEKSGELKAEAIRPKNATGPIPFVIMLHGCGGLDTVTREWAQRSADLFNAEGIGVLVLDSFTTRYVDKSCGWPDLHWGRRRADDAYSALDYLIEKKLAKPNEVYLMGYSNGGTTTLVSMTTMETDHKYRFAAGFAVAPSCFSDTLKSGNYYGPMILFVGEQDDADEPKFCLEMMKKKRGGPVQLIEYVGVNHGFIIKQAPKVLHGWTDAKGVVHMWHMNYDEVAEKDMTQTIVSAIKTKRFESKIEVRPSGAAERK
jgi:dienelactone hydrolase